MVPRHIMIDLETMGTGPYAAIVQIGAVVFNPHDDPQPFEKYEQFNVNVSLVDAVQNGCEMDPDTIMWWMSQGQAARDVVTKGGDKLPIFVAFDRLHDFIIGKTISPADVGVLGPAKELPVDGVWSHGLDFDLPILTNVAKRIGYIGNEVRALWPFRAARDTRTIFDLAKVDFKDGYGTPGFNTTNHVAVNDAWRQAVLVQMAYQKLKVHDPRRLNLNV
jgi:hypothetical protein